MKNTGREVRYCAIFSMIRLPPLLIQVSSYVLGKGSNKNCIHKEVKEQIGQDRESYSTCLQSSQPISMLMFSVHFIVSLPGIRYPRSFPI